MRTLRRSTTATDIADDVEPWSRRRLRSTLAVLAVVGVALLGGLAVTSTLMVRAATSDHDARRPDATNAGGIADTLTRDQLAAAPMLQVEAGDALPSAPAAVPAPTIAVPPSTSTGPAQVPTGFAHTPEGAVGQLAAIDTEVLHAMSVRRTTEVHQAWALPGAPPVESWEPMTNVRRFLGTAGMTDALSASATVSAVPAGGQIKGTDGSDWVLACVLMQVRATVTTTSQIGYGRCERMQWSNEQARWMIAPGAPPAPAPSTWPATERALEAGWRAWADAPEPLSGSEQGLPAAGED